MSHKKLALTFEEWKSRGRSVHSGAIPFHWIDGKPLFREEDTYSIRWKNYWDHVERTAKEVDSWPTWKKKAARSAYAAPAFMDPPAGMDLMPTRELMERNKANCIHDPDAARYEAEKLTWIPPSIAHAANEFNAHMDEVLFKHHPYFGEGDWGMNEEDYF